MSEEQYNKGQIATSQLKTAIWLFLSGRDPASVITLAGAASAILHQLAKNQGKTTFVDFARGIPAAFGGPTLPRSKYNKYVNDKLGINPLKHMSPSCPDTLEIDVEKSAEDVITKAVADYVPLFGQGDDFIKAFLQWSWLNRDGPKVMKDYEKIPKRLRRK